MGKYQKGKIVQGVVTGIETYGAFVAFDEFYSGLIHISEMSHGFVKDIHDFVKVGDIITPNIQVYPVTYPFDLNDVELSIVWSGHSSPAGTVSEDGIVEILEGNKIKICKPGEARVKAVLNGKETQIIFSCSANG